MGERRDTDGQRALEARLEALARQEAAIAPAPDAGLVARVLADAADTAREAAALAAAAPVAEVETTTAGESFWERLLGLPAAAAALAACLALGVGIGYGALGPVETGTRDLLAGPGVETEGDFLLGAAEDTGLPL